VVVTQRMFNDLVDQVNASFERLEQRIKELESAKKPTVKPAEKKTTTKA